MMKGNALWPCYQHIYDSHTYVYRLDSCLCFLIPHLRITHPRAQTCLADKATFALLRCYCIINIHCLNQQISWCKLSRTFFSRLPAAAVNTTEPMPRRKSMNYSQSRWDFTMNKWQSGNNMLSAPPPRPFCTHITWDCKCNCEAGGMKYLKFKYSILCYAVKVEHTLAFLCRLLSGEWGGHKLGLMDCRCGIVSGRNWLGNVMN